jgi:thioredoxin 1
MSENIKQVTDESFKQDVLEADAPVLVDFWAPWCGPCRALAPVIEGLAEEYAGKVTFAKLNTDENPTTPAQLGIRGIPTLIMYFDGEEADRMVGFSPKPAIQKKLDALVEASQAE